MDARQAALTGKRCLRCFTVGRLSAKSAPVAPASTARGETARKPAPPLRIPDKPKPAVIGYTTEGTGDTTPATYSRVVTGKVSEEQYTAGQRIIDTYPKLFPSWSVFVRTAIATLTQAYDDE
jgi:hypothetical protein